MELYGLKKIKQTKMKIDFFNIYLFLKCYIKTTKNGN